MRSLRLITLAATLAGLTWPALAAPNPVTLTIFEWDGYIAPFAAEFEAHAAAKGMAVKLEFLQKGGKEYVITSADDIFQELRAETVDIVTPTNNYFKDSDSRLLKVLAPIDLDKIGHFAELVENLRKNDYATLDGKKFAIPLLGGGYSLAYNADRVTPAPTSWNALVDPRFKNRTSIVSAQYEANAYVAAILTGVKPAEVYDYDKTDRLLMRAVLTKMAGNARAFWDDNPDVDLMAKDLDLITDYGFGVAAANAKGQHWKFADTAEPTTVWFDNISLARRALATPEKAAAAHLLLDFMISPAIQAKIAQMYGVVVPNPKALETVAADKRSEIRVGTNAFFREDLIWQPLGKRTRNGYRTLWLEAVSAAGKDSLLKTEEKPGQSAAPVTTPTGG